MNRFDNLLSVAQTKSAKTSSHAAAVAPAITAPPELSKHKNPDYQKATLYLPKPLHRRLKSVAAQQDRQMSDIIEQLLEQWLDSQPS